MSQEHKKGGGEVKISATRVWAQACELLQEKPEDTTMRDLSNACKLLFLHSTIFWIFFFLDCLINFVPVCPSPKGGAHTYI